MDRVTVKLGAGYRTSSTARSHTWHADLPDSSGGDDSAETPEEMILGALGSCMAQTAKLYAARKEWPLEGVDITLEVERFNAADYPDHDGDDRFIHEIREHIVFHGPLDDEQRDRLREITGKCPVRRIIATPTYFVPLHLADSPAE